MTVGEVFLQSLSCGVITERMNWLTTHQASFNRQEEAAALRLGRLLDSGELNLGCRIPGARHQSLAEEWLSPWAGRHCPSRP